MLTHVQRLPIEVVQSFLERRDAKAAGIKPALAEYILQINDAFNLHRTYRSVTDCAKQLRLKYPELTLPTSKSRVYDAIEFFNADCSVTASAWNSYFADEMMKLADVCLAAFKFDEVRRCFEKAREYRLAASANRVDPRRIQFKHQVVSPDVHLPRMGITPVGILRAYEEAKKIIKSRDISPTDKKRLISEAGRELNITDTEYEEIEG